MCRACEFGQVHWAAATLFFPLFWACNVGAYFGSSKGELKAQEAGRFKATSNELALTCETFAPTRAY
jgi:hypothetical protein